MHSREQYLAALREEYLRGNKKQKTRLLNEARKRTKLNRKVLIRKLVRVPAAVDKPKRRVRGTTYGVELKAPLAQVWELFDFPCGQRLAPIPREQWRGCCGRFLRKRSTGCWRTSGKCGACSRIGGRRCTRCCISGCRSRRPPSGTSRSRKPAVGLRAALWPFHGGRVPADAFGYRYRHGVVGRPPW